MLAEPLEQPLRTSQGQRIAIVASVRSPFCQKDSAFKNVLASDLATMVTNELLNRFPIDKKAIQQFVFGQVIQHPDIPNMSREIALALNMPHVQGYTISCSCITGFQAIANVTNAILTGSVLTGIAGGADSISTASYSLNPRVLQLIKALFKTQNWSQKYRYFKQLSWRELKPHGVNLKDYMTQLSIADLSEQMAQDFQISRQEQDEWALRSHRLATEAWQSGIIREEVMMSFPPPYDNFVIADNGIRFHADKNNVGELPTLVSGKFNTATNFNIAPPCDGSAAVMLMREDVARHYSMKPLGFIRNFAITGNNIWENMLTGCTYASSLALTRANLCLQDIDLIDIHESSAAQLLANLRLFESNSFAIQQLQRTRAIGNIDLDKLNVLGGSLAYGNPRAVSSLRLIIQSLYELNRRGGGISLVASSSLSGLGAAFILETE